MITYVVRMTAHPGRRDELLAVLEDLTRAADADEPGTKVYVFHTVDGDPDAVVSYEVFADEAALAAHRDGPAVAAVLPRLEPLVAHTEAWRGTPWIGTGVPGVSPAR